MKQNITLNWSFTKKLKIYSSLLFLISFLSYGQDYYKSISFNEKIEFGNIEKSSQWRIYNSKENIAINLIGSEINNFVFEKPGVYQINYIDGHTNKVEECSHSLFKENMQVFVSDAKIEYDFSNIKFSRDIKSGVSCDDIVITVPVRTYSKNNTVNKINVPVLSVAGIGCEIKAQPMKSDIQIANETQYIKYKLSGLVKTSSYLMFDFIDFNNQVRTYSPTKIID